MPGSSPSSAMAEPTASVILPAFLSHETIGACLHSLRQQTFRDFETIVVDSSPDDRTAQTVTAGFPEVRLLRSPRRLSAHAARNLGSRQARGRILVFSDPDCRMAPDWLAVLLASQEAGHRAVGGSVDSLRTGWLQAGIHWCKYAWWLSNGPRGPRPELPTANVSYARDLFDKIGPFPEAWCGDTILSRRAARLGLVLWFEPEARVFHDHRASWRSFLGERCRRGLDFGRERPRLEDWSCIRTLAYVLGAPLLTAWMLARSARYVQTVPAALAWLRCLPVLLPGYLARQCGETGGYLKALWRASSSRS